MSRPILPTARITDVSFAAPPGVAMDEFAALFADDPGGGTVAQVIGNSGISSKGMAVNPFREDPRSWSTGRRMERSLTEAKALAGTAVRDALDRAGLRTDEVGAFVTSSTTTHSAPGLDGLMHDLGLPGNTSALSLGPMGCYAAVPALAVCRAWVQAYREPCVLVCVDLFSPHLQPPPYDKEQAVVLTLFGDAATAVVLRPSDAGVPGLDIVDTEQLTAAEHANDLQVHVGDNGLRIRLAPTMPDVVASAVAKPVDELLARNGLRRDDLVWWAVHPGGRRIIDRVESELALPPLSAHASRAVMRDYGNTAGPAVLAVLDRLERDTPVGPGQYAGVLACGPGATIWAMLLRGAS